MKRRLSSSFVILSFFFSFPSLKKKKLLLHVSTLMTSTLCDDRQKFYIRIRVKQIFPFLLVSVSLILAKELPCVPLSILSSGIVLFLE